MCVCVREVVVTWQEARSYMYRYELKKKRRGLCSYVYLNRFSHDGGSEVAEEFGLCVLGHDVRELVTGR